MKLANSGRKGPICDKCQNTGYVMLSERAKEDGVVYAELTAPCPSCARGHAIEFGESGKDRWPEGFWQGRNTEYIVMPAPGRELSFSERRERAAKIAALRLGSVQDEVAT